MITHQQRGVLSGEMGGGFRDEIALFYHHVHTLSGVAMRVLMESVCLSHRA